MLNEYSNTIDPHYSRFSNCKLAYLPKFVTPKSTLVAFSWLIVDMQSDENFELHFQLKLDKTIFCLFIFSLPTGNSCPFMAYLVPCFVCLFYIFCSLSVISLFHKMAPKHNIQVLSGVPKGKKAVICFTEKIHVFDKLHSSMSSAVGHEFNVNESMSSDKYIVDEVPLNKNTHI